MNQRIRQLAEQAGVNLSSFQFSGTPTKYEVSGQELKKFAELIVKECASKVDWILAEGGRTQGDLIKEHFGVGE